MYPLLLPSALQVMEILSDNGVSSTGCTLQYPYTGLECSNEFSFLQAPGNGLNVSVTNQEVVEKFVVLLLSTGLPNFNPSPECEAVFRLFGCLFYFQPCDHNMSVIALGALCREVRDGVCAKVWMALYEFLGSDHSNGLPICEDFPEGKDITS